METVEAEIGAEGGTIAHPGGATLAVEPGTFAGVMSVTLARLPDSSLPVSPDIDLIPSSGYEVTMTAADGTTMSDVPPGVTLQLPVPEDRRDEARLFWVDGERLQGLDGESMSAGGVAAELPHLSRFVAGIPLAEQPDVAWLPWVVALAAALSGLIVVALLARNARRRPRYARPLR